MEERSRDRVDGGPRVLQFELSTIVDSLGCDCGGHPSCGLARMNPPLVGCGDAAARLLVAVRGSRLHTYIHIYIYIYIYLYIYIYVYIY